MVCAPVQYTQEQAGRGKDAYLFDLFRRQDGCFGVHRQDGEKRWMSIHLTSKSWVHSPRRLDAVVVKMPCHRPDAIQCVHDGQGTQIHPVGYDPSRAQGVLSENGRVHDGRSPRSVSPWNPINPLRPRWEGSSPGPEDPKIWQHDIAGVRQQVGLAPQALRVQERTAQALKVQEHGRMKLAVTVQEQIAQALRVKEHAEQL